jgi:hypothetical protein
MNHLRFLGVAVAPAIVMLSAATRATQRTPASQSSKHLMLEAEILHFVQDDMRLVPTTREKRYSPTLRMTPAAKALFLSF